MSRWRGRRALVTGAASGIGRALVEALVARGCVVLATDLTPPAIPGAAGAALDVTAAAAFARVVADFAAAAGGLDYLFNNAGIGLVGAAEELAPADWRRVVEVDLLGVMNGVAAAYPLMLRQGHGHLVNTASGAGLAPRPHMAAYAAAKHGVVGLTVSLRAEAARAGVKVSAFCPGYVATGIMASSRYLGLDPTGLARAIPLAPMSAAECARRALRGVERNAAIIPVSAYVHLDWWLYRLSPAVSCFLARYRARRISAHRRPSAARGSPG